MIFVHFVIFFSYPIKFRPINFDNKKMVEDDSNTKRPVKK